MISGFCHEVDENCFLLGYYAASSGDNPEERSSQHTVNHKLFMTDYIYIHNCPGGGRDNRVQDGWTMW
jgi:hypothetical protein